ncbi:hypothetical protein W02_03940 [Nitrospira sp. KM1]|uniref:serine hydrolase domain-containing protein n=1 Tax=Nitrospira sp. KM1 TaxID=1936990 RepID=UPI0013A76897|nr:serine hydrolase domain-containing protein [Nitrospira sp. KM1]BCA53254.1 hypothetical protein W02_03940 [Nitrospira sp. KM1]
MEQFSSETRYTFPSGSTATFSAGWSFDFERSVLSSPESDLNLYFFEDAFDADVEALALRYWKKVNPDFDWKVYENASFPGSDGWSVIHQISYDVPVRESQSVFAVVRVVDEKAFISLAEGSAAAFGRRGAQFQTALYGWKPAGLKKEALGERTAKLFDDTLQNEFTELVNRLMTDLQIPGASIAVISDGKIVYERAFGVKQLGSPDEVQNTTPFMIGSITKPLTTLMLGKLVELGTITWDTPVQTLLPDFTLADKNLTSKMLMKHTACACTGMPRRDLFVIGPEDVSAEDMIVQMASWKPTTGFGETFQYSNELVAVGGYAGASAYRRSSSLFRSYQQAMNDLIFMPLGMHTSFVKPSPEQNSSLAAPHAQDFNGTMTAIPQAIDNMVYSVAPAGSIWSTAGDLAKYVLLELNEGKGENGQQLVASDQIQKRRAQGVKISDTAWYGLGLGILDDRGLQAIGHNGGTFGFSSDLWFVPKDRLGMVVLTNAGMSHAFHDIVRQKLMELLYDAEKKSEERIISVLRREEDGLKQAHERVKTQPTDIEWIKEYVGTYHNGELGVLEVKMLNNDIVFDVGRWSSTIGSAVEHDGDKLIALTAAPWSGSWEIMVVNKPKKLILDFGQHKYEFVEAQKD